MAPGDDEAWSSDYDGIFSSDEEGGGHEDVEANENATGPCAVEEEKEEDPFTFVIDQHK